MRKVGLRPASLAAVVAISLFAASVSAQIYAPPNDQVLHVFQGGENDGILPAGGVVFDAAGNLYGATTYGGNGGGNCIGGSCGTVYQLVRPAKPGGAWTESILYNFTGVTNQQDGELPNGAPVIDSEGNLYGVTAYGGTGGCELFGGVDGCGTVYEVSPPSVPGGPWTKTTIYSFQGGTDGYLPIGNLIFDDAGNLYGATSYGGGVGSCNAPFYQHCGTIFELFPPSKPGGVWQEKVLYSFKGGASDGANPNGGLIFDEHGALYGTTYYGGDQRCTADAGTGCGTIFLVRPTNTGSSKWAEIVLHIFQPDGVDGGAPTSGLVRYGGNFYGTTPFGGGNHGSGTIYQLKPPSQVGEDWLESPISYFGGDVGAQPMASLTLRGDTFYGAASVAGRFRAGTVFRFMPPSSDGQASNYRVLCDFPPGNQAAEPESTLTFDENGIMYGTAQVYDHRTGGAVFMLKP